MSTARIAEICRLAADHGLHLDPDALELEELGLDFQVAIGPDTSGQSWVLRIPRRPDAAARAIPEGRLLSLLDGRLPVAIPRWEVHTRALIAYRLLPGEPGLVLDADGRAHWRFDAQSPAYTRSLAELLARLHTLEADRFADSGIEVYTPESWRRRKAADIATVTAEFDVAGHLAERWNRWLDDDRYWPDHVCLTHGEIYPAHQLMTGERIDAILDWTTAAVADPARDFAFHHATVGPDAFAATVRRYVELGGRTWPMLAGHCAELIGAAPVEYGLFALHTGDARHLAQAAAQLNPDAGGASPGGPPGSR